MDVATARILNDVTADFYRRESASFSQTRQTPWAGWQRVLDVAVDALAPDMRVLDVACGNLRFERYLRKRIGAPFSAYVVDNCAALVEAGAKAQVPGGSPAEALADASVPAPANAPAASSVPSSAPVGGAPSPLADCNIAFRPLDIVRTLLDDGDLAAAISAPPCDLSVMFGFAHHLALPEHRRAMLDALVGATRPGGYVAVSFWQFMNDARLAEKARETTARGRAALELPELGAQNYLLGWQHESDVFRFCHHFDEREIDELVASLAPRAYEVARFSADGKSGALNRYLVLQVRV